MGDWTADFDGISLGEASPGGGGNGWPWAAELVAKKAATMDVMRTKVNSDLFVMNLDLEGEEPGEAIEWQFG